ncbi:hypothetical protein COLO4_19513 [Corchorus olitorius]|uniref:SET domain-containing protein n=1 Tax=Corchorus olitorius TaxID=93759 RepID=A0A1R3J547_9ROSI|nr:hypothetical protein COLO4_19513 [Corchorus olitorius]
MVFSVLALHHQVLLYVVEIATVGLGRSKFGFGTEKCGAGIVAEEDIKHGEFVIEYVGEAGCRQKLGVKPSKPKISSDAALKLVAYQVALSSPKLKAMLFGNNVCYESPFQTIKKSR